jgi:integrase
MQGVNVKVVSERLGHSKVDMTMDTYQHVMPQMQEEAANKLEDMLFKTGSL